jgi:hypothetical protein
LEDITTQLGGIYLRVFDQITLDSYNQSAVYTYTNWILSQSQDISCKKYQPASQARQCSGYVSSSTLKFVNSGIPTVIIGNLQFQ